MQIFLQILALFLVVAAIVFHIKSVYKSLATDSKSIFVPIFATCFDVGVTALAVYYLVSTTL